MQSESMQLQKVAPIADHAHPALAEAQPTRLASSVQESTFSVEAGGWSGDCGPAASIRHDPLVQLFMTSCGIVSDVTSIQGPDILPRDKPSTGFALLSTRSNHGQMAG